jgi:hypothetical protein
MKAVGIQYGERDVAGVFGLALRAARNARGILQDQLSEICDFDRT